MKNVQRNGNGWTNAFPAISNHPIWTRPYYGIQYRKNVNRGIHISVCTCGTGAVAKYIDLYLYKHLNQSNFTPSKEEYCPSVEEALKLAESW